MGIFSGYLLTTDFDGTLFGGDGKVCPVNLPALERFKAEGGLLSAATGRTRLSAKPRVDFNLFNAPSIVCNGAVVCDLRTGERLIVEALPPSVKPLMNKIRQKYPSVGISYFVGDDNYTDVKTEMLVRYLDFYMDYHFVSDFTTIPACPDKIVIAVDESKIAGLRQMLEEETEDCIDLVQSSGILLELNHRRGNKGTMLPRLAKLCGVSIEHTCAIGDYENDCTMLRAAGISAAPENAVPMAKELADVVVCNHRQGAVADFVNYIEQKIKHN